MITKHLESLLAAYQTLQEATPRLDQREREQLLEDILRAIRKELYLKARQLSEEKP